MRLLSLPRIRPMFAAAALFIGTNLATPLSAGEGYFGYSYTADTLPKGGNEAELWLTSRWDKGLGTYQAYDLLVGYEHGFTNRFQAAFYVSALQINSYGAFPPDTDGEVPYPNNDYTRINSVRASAKYNFLSPYKGIGLSFVWETFYVFWYAKVDGAKTTQISFEPKLILQKNFFDDQLVIVDNLTVESEWRKFPGEEGEPAAYENEFSITNSFGASYRLVPRVFAGAEARFHTDILNGEQNHFDWFAGPVVQYSTQSWYLTATYLRQLHGSPSWSYPVDEAMYPNNGFALEEDTKNEFRLKFGLKF